MQFFLFDPPRTSAHLNLKFYPGITYMEIQPESAPYQKVDTLCVLAPGLLGASVAMACKENRMAERVHIWSRRASSRAKLVGKEWCDEIFDSPEDAAAQADFTVICAPVDFVVPLYKEIGATLKPDAIVTDVGSTKSIICRQAQAMVESAAHFVGAHPMAGSEKTGMEYASADLFNNRPCIVTPLEESNESATQRIVQFWKSLGATTYLKTPEDHDEIVAHVSHLPHLLASSLCKFLNKTPEEWSLLNSTGLKDTTRIAAGDPRLWKAIIETNQNEIGRALSEFQDELHCIQSALTNGNMAELVVILQQGKQYRDRLAD